MVHRLAKGMKFIADEESQRFEREEIENLISDQEFKIHSTVQNVYTGATMSLFSTPKDNKWYIKFSSRDLGSFGKDEKTAKEQFMKMAGIEGELI
jgi:hypothetical protein